MEIFGIIMEVNPFHNGHAYFLNEAKKIANGKPLVCIISTNVVQRGQFSVLNKHTKTKLLLDHGVDIVCELPTVLANQGGEYFALNALKILSQFKITHLIFGSESNNLSDLLAHANNQSRANFKNGIHTNLNSLKSNDILGISYIKAANLLHLNIQFKLVKRIFSNYNEKTFNNQTIASATAIRNNLSNKQDIANFLPKYALDNSLTVNEQMLFNLFKINLRNAIDNNITIFLAEDNQLLMRMRDVIEKYNPQDINHLLELCKDRNNSRYKYSRILINVALLIVDDNYNAINYCRILGFNPKASSLISKSSFTSLADCPNIIAQIEVRSANLFSLLTTNSSFNEFNRKPLIYKNVS